MSTFMKLSIVLCTYNNAESLRMTLKDMAKCNLGDASQVEVIIVNNNSTDHTRRVYGDVEGLFKCSVTYLVESNQGLSHARNLGLAAASGEYVLFTDDDAIIPSTWVQAYLRNIESSYLDCLYSRIKIHWGKPIPDWYISEFKAFFVHLDYGSKRLKVTDVHHEFFGKNFCVRRSILTEFGGFDPKLGRCGNKLISGEETLIYRRLIAEKRQVMYFPEAQVGHRLKDREYKIENIKAMFSDSSYSSYQISKVTGNRRLFNRPIYLLIINIFDIPKNMIQLLKHFLEGDKNRVRYFQLRLLRNFKLVGLWLLNP
jgi:glycosyltransferase involved in cell wall biosynthesis